MPHEETIGLLVSDHSSYARYRQEIAPLLLEAGGRFRYDFEVSRTLKSEDGGEFNRVFVIRFPDRAARDAFFGDRRYIAARERYFAPAVQRVATLTVTSG